MALISAGEWIDRYGADAERRAARVETDAKEPHLTFHVEVEPARPERRAEARAWCRQRLSRMPRLYGSFRPLALRPLRRFAPRRR